ncbi:hypothetical protein PIB30_046929 [Stylosanthes scabra]|uniref:RRM domain-containing protein n=1 Tax=Stylosanthes scabra TaxID=79078 RepID=A0ABU6YIB4_9FABA|nr:hypothetical protein [Stylosanthes scabra]
MEMDPGSGKLFIGGISWDTNEDRLRQYFQRFGDVVEAVIMKDRTTGRARGFGFVVFADASVAELVVMEKHVIDGRTVEAKKAVPRDDQNVLNKSNSSSHSSPGPTPSRTKKIFVGGLASTVTESDFKKYFDQFGTITDVVVMYDHNTQRPRGFGFITYDSEEAVDKVLYKSFHELNGKLVEVKRAGFNAGVVGRNGLKIDGRSNAVTVGHSEYPLFGHSYGTGLNFEPPLTQNGTSNFTSSFIGRTLNSSFSGSPSRYSNAMGYAGANVGNNSAMSSTSQNLWGNGNLNYAANIANSDALAGYRNENSSMASYGSIGSLWSSSLGTDQTGIIGSGYGKGSLSSSGDVNLGSKTVGYGKNSDNIVTSSSSYSLPNLSYDEAYNASYDAGSFYGDRMWSTLPSELEDSSSLGFGIDHAVSGLMRKGSGSHIGAYAVANTQPNRGIVA